MRRERRALRFGLCATVLVARIPGVIRSPVDRSFAGTDDAAAALAVEPWEDCAGCDPSCMIDE